MFKKLKKLIGVKQKKDKGDLKKLLILVLTICILGTLAIYIFHHLGNPPIAMSKDTKKQLSNALYMELKEGVVVIEMLPDVAPKHVKQITSLVRNKFYDGLLFHRVIDGFMVQGGDPNGNGTGGSGQNIPAEFSALPHRRGAVSMARSSNPDSASSQFFIVTKDSQFLDGQYTIWGYVISGMEYVDKIKKGDLARDGMVTNPDKIVSMKVAIDAEKESAINDK